MTTRQQSSPEAFSLQDNELLYLACPSREDVPFFNHCMRLAKSRGMSWRDGLEYIIAQRRER
jgi:hypothetical protein